MVPPAKKKAPPNHHTQAKMIPAPNKIGKHIVSPNSKEHQRLRNTLVVYCYQFKHPSILGFSTSRKLDPTDDGYNYPLAKDIDHNGEFSKENKFFCHAKIRKAPEIDKALVNHASTYLRRLFVQIDTDRLELKTRDECFDILLTVCEVSSSVMCYVQQQLFTVSHCQLLIYCSFLKPRTMPSKILSSRRTIGSKLPMGQSHLLTS